MKDYEFENLLKKENNIKIIEEGIKKLNIEIYILLEVVIRYRELKNWQKQLEQRIRNIIIES